MSIKSNIPLNINGRKNKFKELKDILESKKKMFFESNINEIDEVLKKDISRNVISIPFSVYYPKLDELQTIKSKIRITIPGIVDNNRRDYASVFRIFEEEKGHLVHLLLNLIQYPRFESVLC